MKQSFCFTVFVFGSALLVANTISAESTSIFDTTKWKGRGARVPFVEIEAEHSLNHTGHPFGNDRTYGHLSSEASGRRAVQLSVVGQFVEFVLPIRANSIVVRYSIPDTTDGKGRDASLDLYVNDHLLRALPVTSRYSWFYGGYALSNYPSKGGAHYFYDSTRTLFDKEYPPGTKVRLQVNSVQHSPHFTIDLADFELVPPPIAAPKDSISVLSYGADPTGKLDSTPAFTKAVHDAQAQKRVVYIPAGHYTLHDKVHVDQVTIAGAGPWYSVLGAVHTTDRHKMMGIFGKFAGDGVASKDVHLRDFAMIGEITERNDKATTSALGGSLSHSTVENLWLQHVKVGAWFDGKMTNFTMRNCRIMDTLADGVNFHLGVTNSTVENTFVRNTGDDGLAMWSEKYVEAGNRFIHNTVGLPIWANNIAIYGGRGHEVSGNLVYDTVTNGGGIHLSNRYRGVQNETALHGPIRIEGNTLIRTGNSDFNWHFGVGAIWFDGLNEDIHADIEIKDCDLIDSSAISYVEGKVYGVKFENILINGTGTYAIQIQTTAGDSTFKNVQAINVQQPIPTFNCHSAGFNITLQGAQNRGWFSEKPDCRDLKSVVPNWAWVW